MNPAQKIGFVRKYVIRRVAFKMENLENGQKILFGQPLPEIPPQPPFNKGGQGGFLAGQWCKEKSWLVVAVLLI
jgi:hypothetical protein